jgi:hypothetical protein
MLAGAGATLLAGCAAPARTAAAGPEPNGGTPRAVRLGDGPIITPASHPSIGANIQGPSLIRAPDWLPGRLGRYYLYFADHKGSFIRLAHADALEGPWRIHAPGALRLDQTPFLQAPPPASDAEIEAHVAAAVARGLRLKQFADLRGDLTVPHIASPDAHVDEAGRRIVLYYHGLESLGRQATRVAASPDGVNFVSGDEILGQTYWRAFRIDGWTYAMAMPGQFYRSRDPLGGFEAGPLLFERDMRHAALLLRGRTLHVAWTRVGDAPERIYHSAIEVGGPWEGWRAGPEVELLRPERDWEGARLPLAPSMRSGVDRPVNQLRDPAFFDEDGRAFMVYAVAGESGLALAEVTLPG